MEWIAAGLCVVLATIGGAHVYWAFGGMWPGKTRVDLANIVIGHQEMPGFLPTMAVAIIMFGLAGFALLPVWGGSGIPAWPAVEWLTRGIAAVFLLRALATVVMPWFIGAAEPFRSLDRWVYAPLCVLLGAGFARLAMAVPVN
jgi:hypothetical protein